MEKIPQSKGIFAILLKEPSLSGFLGFLSHILLFLYVRMHSANCISLARAKLDDCYSNSECSDFFIMKLQGLLELEAHALGFIGFSLISYPFILILAIITGYIVSSEATSTKRLTKFIAVFFQTAGIALGIVSVLIFCFAINHNCGF